MSEPEAQSSSTEPGLLSRGELVGGTYRIERMIGQGGMGEVFSARDERDGARVAVKWVRPGEGHARSRERLIREWHLARQVVHPNVVRILDAGEERGSGYLVMELLEGEALGAWVASGPYDPAFVVDLAMPVMRGVAAAHAAGIVHRDLKPENVILERASGGVRPTLIDFGISRAAAIGVYGDRKLTQHGVAVGTPLYMAPEQLVGAGEADPQCDVYALGVILFELLTGRAPFESPPEAPGLIREKIDRPALRLSSVRPDADARLDAVIARALERSPSKRWGTVAELARALEPFGAARFDGDDPHYRGPSPVERPGTTVRVVQQAQRSRARWLAVGAAALVLLAVGLAVGIALGAREPSSAPAVIEGHAASVSPPAEPWREPDAPQRAELEPPSPVEADAVAPQRSGDAPPAGAAPRRVERRRVVAPASSQRSARRGASGRSGRLSVDDF
ncbi:MAG: protein kinase [Sandaracinaceae bacterium]|nr:protein kinase [Sandaracinaceae bacterium]